MFKHNQNGYHNIYSYKNGNEKQELIVLGNIDQWKFSSSKEELHAAEVRY